MALEKRIISIEFMGKLTGLSEAVSKASTIISGLSTTVKKTTNAIKPLENPINKVKNSFDKLRRTTHGHQVGMIEQQVGATRLANKLEDLNNKLFDVNRTFSDTNRKEKESNTFTGKLRDGVNRLAFQSRKLDHSTGKMTRAWTTWRMEGLSALFLGMEIKNMFSRMITPVLEIVGVFEVWRAMLISVLGPVLIPLGIMLIELMVALMDLPEPVKKFIGAFAVFGFIFGSILMIIGLVVVSFGGLLTLFETVGAALSGIGAVVLILYGLFEILMGYVRGDMWLVFTGLIGVIAGLIVLLVGGIPAAIAVVIYIIIRLAEKFTWLKGILLMIGSAILTPFLTLFDVIKAIINLLSGGSLKDSLSMIGSSTKDMWNTGKNLLFNGEETPKKMATGGIVRSPTNAIIGEAGPEAVIPLDQGGIGGITINITGNSIGSQSDITNLIDRIKRELIFELRRNGI